MSKLKTKSSVKKRFSITKNGKIKRFKAGKRHGMIKLTGNKVRKRRGGTMMAEVDAPRVIKIFAPYGINH